MNQTAMHAAVAILKRMDINKAEGGRRRRQHRVNAVVAHAVVCLQQSAHEIVQIIGPGADELRERLTMMVPIA